MACKFFNLDANFRNTGRAQSLSSPACLKFKTKKGEGNDERKKEKIRFIDSILKDTRRSHQNLYPKIKDFF